MAQNAKDPSLLDIKSNPEKAFEQIVAVHSEALYWHIRQVLGEHEDANDVVQDVFVKVWKGLERFRCEAALATWLYRIAVNECRTFLAKRKRKGLQLSQSDEPNWPEPAAEPNISSDETLRLMQEAIEKLPPKQREVFLLRYYQEMPYQQMSDVLQTSVGSLKASYHHAVQKIQHYLTNAL